LFEVRSVERLLLVRNNNRQHSASSEQVQWRDYLDHMKPLLHSAGRSSEKAFEHTAE